MTANIANIEEDSIFLISADQLLKY